MPRLKRALVIVALAFTVAAGARAAHARVVAPTAVTGAWAEVEQSWGELERSWSDIGQSWRALSVWGDWLGLRFRLWLADSFGGALGDLVALAEGLDELHERLAPLSVPPVEAGMTSRFGYRRDPIHRRIRFHAGIDFGADRGAVVHAAGAGRVTLAGRSGGYGQVVAIDHGLGVVTRYAHLERVIVREGDEVETGDIIATVGSSGRATGPHLHFEVRRDGEPVDPRAELLLP